jgi:hypothetical protein
MDDARVWEFEEGLWTGNADHYKELIDSQCVMVLPEPPYVMAGQKAIDAVSDTPRWSDVQLSEKQVARPQEGMIVVAYKAEAQKDDKRYEVWRVVQHQQTPSMTPPT